MDFYLARHKSILQIALLLLKSTDGSDVCWSKEVKGNMYDMIVEGFQLLSRWNARICEQCAWKFSRSCKDASLSFSDYEKETTKMEGLSSDLSYIAEKFEI